MSMLRRYLRSVQISVAILCEDRHDAPRRRHIDEVGKILGDPDRDARSARGLELDNTCVDPCHP